MYCKCIRFDESDRVYFLTVSSHPIYCLYWIIKKFPRFFYIYLANLQNEKRKMFMIYKLREDRCNLSFSSYIDEI